MVDKNTLEPLTDATITVGGIAHDVGCDSVGWYYRPLTPGEYTIRVSAPGYAEMEQTVVVPASLYTTAHFELVST